MTKGMRRRVLRALCAAGACSTLVALGSAAGAANKSFPFMAGTWNVAAKECPGTCTDTWTLTPIKHREVPPYVYQMKDAKGFYTNDITIADNGTTNVFTETCHGCTGFNALKVTFAYPKHGVTNTFAGTWRPFAPRSNAPGAPLFGSPTRGTISGEQVTPEAPPVGAGTPGWGPSKCMRAYAAWSRQHPNASLLEQGAETSMLDDVHGCDL